MTIFGADWEQLALDDVRRFLETASEDRQWEAKGPEADAGEIRRQLCGFANTHTGGYLLLGVSGERGEWRLEGRRFPGRTPEPAVWLDSIARDGGRLQPVPHIETRAFPIADDRFVTVTRVEPIAAPPCVLDGVVWERVDGRTVQVRDIARLRELFVTGQRVFDAAADDARRVALDVYEWGSQQGRNKPAYLQGAVGISTTTRAVDVGERVFDQRFHDRLERFLEEKILRRDGHYFEQEEYWSESAYTRGGRITRPTQQDALAFVRCDARGMVGAYFREEIEDGTVDELFAWWVMGAWGMALATQMFLGGAADYFAFTVVNGYALKESARRRERIEMQRGPIEVPRFETLSELLLGSRDEAAEHMASVRRELLRAVGLPAYEASRDANDVIQSTDWSPWQVWNELKIYAGRRRGRRR